MRTRGAAMSVRGAAMGLVSRPELALECKEPFL